MTIYLSDTFTEAANTELSLHTPEVGGAGAWTKHAIASDNLTQTIRCQGGLGWAQCSGSPVQPGIVYIGPTATGGATDIEVDMRLNISDAASQRRVGIVLRADPADNAYYLIFLVASIDPNLYIYRFTGPAFTGDTDTETEFATLSVDDQVGTDVKLRVRIRNVSGNPQIEILEFRGVLAPTLSSSGAPNVTVSGNTITDADAAKIVRAGRNGINLQGTANRIEFVSFDTLTGGANTPPSWSSTPANKVLVQNVAMSPDDVSSRVSDPGDTVTFTESPAGDAWPAGIDISSAGVISGTPTAIGTASVRVRATDTAPQSVDSDAFTIQVVAPLSGSVTVVAPLERHVFQRSGNNATIALSGTWSATGGSAVQVRIVAHGTDNTVLDWTDIATGLTGSSGNWSGNVVVPLSPTWLNLQVRVVDSGGAALAQVASTTRWGVGYVFATLGNSEIEYHFLQTSAPAPTYDDRVATIERPATTWSMPYWQTATAQDDPYGNGMVGMSKRFLDLALQPAPVAFVRRWSGGSSLFDEWNPDDLGGSTVLQTAINYLKTINSGKYEAVIWTAHANYDHETDQQAESLANAKARLQRLITRLRANLINGSSKSVLPIIVGQYPRLWSADTTQDDVTWGHTAVAIAAPSLAPEVYTGGWAYDKANADNLHPSSQSMGLFVGPRLGATLAHIVNGGTPAHMPPRIVEWNRIGTAVTVTLEYPTGSGAGTDITPASGQLGWEYAENGVAVPIQSAVRNSPTSITVNLLYVPSTTPERLRYAYGMDAGLVDGNSNNPASLANLIRDNSAYTLPLQPFNSDDEAEVLVPTLGIQEPTSLSTVSNVTLVTPPTLTISEPISLSTVSALTLFQNSALVIANAASLSTASNLTLAQTQQDLSIDELASESTVDAIAFSSADPAHYFNVRTGRAHGQMG